MATKHRDYIAMHAIRFACWIFAGTTDETVHKGCRQMLEACGCTETIESLCDKFGLKRQTSPLLSVVSGGKVRA